jgi:hypothetical protein
VSEQTPEEMIEGMFTPSEEHMAAFGASLKGVGANPQSYFKTLQFATAAMVADGRSVSDEVARLRADSSLPRDHRFKEAETLQETTLAMLKRYNAAGQGAAKALRAELEHGVLPKPSDDVGHRQLARQEIQAALGGKSGQALAGAAIELIGKNPSWDAELVRDYGNALFQGHGVEASLPALRAQAVAKYAARADGSDKQKASRAALAEMKNRNIEGRVAAYFQAGQAFLRRNDK